MAPRLRKKQKQILEAVKTGTLKCVESMIDSYGITIDETYFDNILLKAAIERKHQSLINSFLNRGFRVRNPTEVNCTTVLHYAVTPLTDGPIIRKILNNDASLYDKNAEGETPFDLAVKEELDDVIRSMLLLYNFKYAQPLSEQGLLHFHTACSTRNLKIIEKFVEHGFPLNSHAGLSNRYITSGYTPLHLVAHLPSDCGRFAAESNFKLIAYLVNKGADYTLTNNEGKTSIHHIYYNYCHCIMDTCTRRAIKIIFQNSSTNQYINSIDNSGLSHFHICSAVNIPEIIKKFIENGENINHSVPLDSDKHPGYTPLHFATTKQHKSMVELLLKNGADVSLKCKEGSTPLHLACEHGDLDVKLIKLLLHFSAQLNSQDNKGCTPLHCVFYKENPNCELVTYLLLRIPKDENYTDSKGLSVFHIACTRDNPKIVEHFLKRGVSPNLCTAPDNDKYPSYSALHFAVLYNRKATVELLLKYGGNPNANESSKNMTSLHIFCLNDYRKFYDKLVKDDYSEWTLTHENQINILNLLLHYEVDVNAKDIQYKTPLMYLCQFLYSSLTWDYRYIRSKAESQKNCYQTPDVKILKAVQKIMIDIALILIKQGADLNAYTHTGESILHIISKNQQLEVAPELAELFLKNKANVQIADNEGVTPLHVAVKTKSRKLVDIFLCHNADVNSKTATLMTPLHVASNKSSSCSVIAELLLKNNCDVDSQNVDGNTALHLAIKHANYSITIKLLRYGADLNCENACGDTPALGLKLDRIYSSDILLTLLDHILKLEIIGWQINSKAKEFLHELRLEFYSSVEEDQEIALMCQRELEEMKNKKINRYVNLYNILFKDDTEMARLVTNPSLKRILTDNELEDKFPIYGEILKLKYMRGSKKMTSLDCAKTCLTNLSGFLLPDHCSEKIIRHLTNNDLRVLNEMKFEVSRKRRKNFEAEETDRSTKKEKRLKK